MPLDSMIPATEVLPSRKTQTPLLFSLLRLALGLLVINLCAFALLMPGPTIDMPSEIDFGLVESGITKTQIVEIKNRSSSTITCLGATEACGYGCHNATGLPKTIAPGKSIQVSVEYKTPFPDELAQRGISSGSVVDEMTLYFDDIRVREQILQIRCQINLPP